MTSFIDENSDAYWIEPICRVLPIAPSIYQDHAARAAHPEKLSARATGDSYDNALAETVIGLFEAEVIRRRGPWRSLGAVEFATLEWVDRFNNRRPLEPIGNMPPAEAEAADCAQLEAVPIAA